VALAAIQELVKENQRLKTRDQKLEEEIVALQKQVQSLIAGGGKAETR